MSMQPSRFLPLPSPPSPQSASSSACSTMLASPVEMRSNSPSSPRLSMRPAMASATSRPIRAAPRSEPQCPAFRPLRALSSLTVAPVLRAHSTPGGTMPRPAPACHAGFAGLLPSTGDVDPPRSAARAACRPGSLAVRLSTWMPDAVTGRDALAGSPASLPAGGIQRLQAREALAEAQRTTTASCDGGRTSVSARPYPKIRSAVREPGLAALARAVSLGPKFRKSSLIQKMGTAARESRVRTMISSTDGLPVTSIRER
ncbi:MAG: hypothetical protein BWZ02_01952 [Lentisphaerae bacterium ADurb.BinA184]|nr:MAG: hypothetical protein BWZ02_01952 [Lentisphaerae bacterium ADurb.BinA184]